MTLAYPKPQTMRSKAITNSARDQACTLREPGCEHTGTVVFCHVRIHAGGSMKPHDFQGFYGCGACHAKQEARSVDWKQVCRAVFETQAILFERGILMEGKRA